MTNNSSIGIILRNLRGNKTQEEIASELGITKSSWVMYEQDERIPRDEIKVRISEYFGMSIQEIFYPQIEHKQCLRFDIICMNKEK